MNARYAEHESSNIEHLNRLLGSDDADCAEVEHAVNALSDDELVSFGLNAYRMNLMSLLGPRWPRERVDRAARAAAISKIWLGWEYHHHYLPRLTSQQAPVHLQEFPLDLIRQQLSLGRGLILVSFHQGHMRHIPSDLAHAGITMCMPLARDSFNDYRSAQLANPDAAMWEHFKYANVEDRGGTLALARTLAKGGCIFATIDGNTGIDGPRGDDRRASVRMLDSNARVKDGLLGLAARFGSPVLPIIAHTVEGRRVCSVAPVLDPGGPLAGEDAANFVAEATQRSYSFLADDLLSHADEWCGGDLFHQWRVPDAPTTHGLDEVEQRMSQDLQAGGRVLVNASRIVELPRDNDIVWTDVMTLRCYKLPGGMAELADKLSPERGGVDLEWLEHRAESERSKIWGLMCQLASRDALRSQAGAAG
ncbi:MAG: hypothetical protein ACREP7_11570 [Lysobacter sp.]